MSIDDILRTRRALEILGISRRLNSLEGKPWASGTVKSVNGTLPDGKGDVTVASGGTPGGTSGQLQYNAAGSFGGVTVSGDGTLDTTTGALTVTKTNGAVFAASATTDTTNASNISTGTLPAGRLPNPSATTLGGIQSIAAQSHKFLTSISTSGVPTLTQPAAADLSDGTTGSGSVVLATSPTLVTAVLGSSTATTQAVNDNSTKVATTAYVDRAVLGQNYKEACKYATTAALPTVTYSNGSSGSGATLTAVGFGAVSFDGSTPSVGDRVLVKNQSSSLQNGIYTVTVVGGVATLFVLTRATDFNQSAEIFAGDLTFVINGSTLSTTTWAYTGGDNPTLGTDAITFTQVAGQGSFIAGTGIMISGTTISNRYSRTFLLMGG